MSPLLNRSFLSQAVIIVAVCVGAWMMVVKPQVDEIDTLEGRIADVAALPQGMGQQTIQDIAGRMSELHARVADIQHRNQFASDTSRVYGILTDLAAQHHVHLQGLQPGAPSPSASKESITVGRIELTVDGTYDDVARFVDGINSLHAFVRLESLQLSPAMLAGKAGVIARLGFDVLKFEMADALKDLGGVANAQP
jgi:Tfp pilus assembly protein PilO